MQQLSFISTRWPKAKAPKREQVCKVLDELIPWAVLEAETRPGYQSDCRRTGRKGYSLTMMLRCLVLSYVWQLSDEAPADFILDSLAAARFIGTDPWEPRPPSASAIRNFRHGLQRQQKGFQWLRLKIDAAMAAGGLQWRQGSAQEPVFKRVMVKQGEKQATLEQ